jgi:predicted porin
MSKTKKLAAAALAVLALAAVPATSVAVSGSEGVRVACNGSSGGGCQI